MPSLENDFKELCLRIQQGRDMTQASYEPVYYLVFDPAKILEVKRLTHAWSERLKKDGWTVRALSVSDKIEELLKANSFRAFWEKGEKKNPLHWAKFKKSIDKALTEGEHTLLKAIEAELESLANENNGLLLLTDLEALHPYVRIGAIEGQLQSKFSVPTIILYPGTRTGTSSLRYLGFYPDDGNYRSVHVGGN